MTSTNKPGALALAALILITASLCFTAYTVQTVSENNRIFESRRATLRSLASMRDEAARTQGGLKLFEKTPDGPTNLENAVKKILPSSALEVTRKPDVALANGWMLLAADITVARIAPGEAGRLIEYLENQLPPWRLDAFEYAADTAESGRAKLTLQSIARSQR